MHMIEGNQRRSEGSEGSEVSETFKGVELFVSKERAFARLRSIPLFFFAPLNSLGSLLFLGGPDPPIIK